MATAKKKNELIEFEEAEVVEEEVKSLSTQVTPMAMIQQGMDQGIPIENMTKLFDLQLRWEENEAKKSFNDAFAKFKQETITIVKDKKVGYKNRDGTFTGYKHATLANVVNTITPFLSKHNLSYRWDVVQDGGLSTVTCVLSHSEGHSIQVSMVAEKDDSGKKNDIQQVASTVTYLQRYTLLSITGLAASDQDDDGQGSGDDVEYITESQVCDYVALMNEVKANHDQLMGYLSIKCGVLISDPAQIPAEHFDLAVKALESKRGK